jgi:4a-hydroxytetrahydrobiopterin dehydratase
MAGLSAKTCVPCRGSVPPLAGEELRRLMNELDHGWNLVGGHHLEKAFGFADFRDAFEFVKRVGEMCEEQGHHGDIFLAWGKVTLSVWTHKIDGLTESDFIWAAKAEELLETA